MATRIEWTDESWNPITGCTPISEGCQNCYAKRMANRLRGRYGYPKDEPFKVTYHPDKLDRPLEWKEPRMVFVCSMSDLFHKDVDFITIGRIFFNALRTKHTYLFLTKRPERMKEFIEWYEKHQVWGGNLDLKRFKNIWLGVTAENQQRADERIPILLQIPAAVRFVSVEPMLGLVNLTEHYYMPDRSTNLLTGIPYDWDYDEEIPEDRTDHLDWVICGAETGPGARYMKPKWAFDLHTQCERANVPFFFKKASKWDVIELPREYPK